MTEIEFEWDPAKDRANHAKHGVSFAEASSAFYDEEGLLMDDPDHSEDENHFILMGISSTLRLLVVVHCYRGRSPRSGSSRPERQIDPSLPPTQVS